ncbi:MAG: hypothetical protein JXR49_14665 [Acidobacteria bacterium]|nr:hypothetical protein [Acidobacteriota bacterium]
MQAHIRYITLILLALTVLTFEVHSQSVQRYPVLQPLPNHETASILKDNTLFTVYGRAFGVAPILGRLGTYKSFEDMEIEVTPWLDCIKERNGKKGAIAGIHLIYAMATPCVPDDDCLLYLEGRERDIVGKYIKPAAERGWMVILDTQVGKSDPVEQVQRIIDRGYLKYENVAVAIDPEFRVYPGRERPGTPIGTVQAWQINKVQRLLNDYVREHKLKRKKILIVHQFGDANVDDGVPFMIENKTSLKTFKHVELVIDADGLGEQAVKVVKYNKMTDSKVYPFIKFRGIKVFFPNPWEKNGHFDKPPMDLDQIFGLEPVMGGPRMRFKPDVLIIA